MKITSMKEVPIEPFSLLGKWVIEMEISSSIIDDLQLGLSEWTQEEIDREIAVVLGTQLLEEIRKMK